MGRSSSAKRERRHLQRRRPDLERRLAEQVDLLHQLGRAYDAGAPVMALPLATCVRVCVHAGQQPSLLEQLGLLDALDFHDSRPTLPAGFEDISNFGLVTVTIETDAGASWKAPLDQLALNNGPTLVRFPTWWRSPVLAADMNKAAPLLRRQTWSRRDFVLFLANKEGGAHVDQRSGRELDRLLHEHNLMGWTSSDSTTTDEPLGSPIPASVRQIAFELEKTLEPVLGGRLLDDPATG